MSEKYSNEKRKKRIKWTKMKRWKIPVRVKDGYFPNGSQSTATASRTQSGTAWEMLDTPSQAKLTAPLILLTLLVFHPQLLARSTHTSITLLSPASLSYVQRSNGGFRKGWMKRSLCIGSECSECGLCGPASSVRTSRSVTPTLTDMQISGSHWGGAVMDTRPPFVF